MSSIHRDVIDVAAVVMAVLKMFIEVLKDFARSDRHRRTRACGELSVLVRLNDVELVHFASFEAVASQLMRMKYAPAYLLFPFCVCRNGFI